jgi:phospholipase A1
MAHRPNYLLVAANNFGGYDSRPYREQLDDPTMNADDTEAQFQISTKMLLGRDLFDAFDLYAAYTNRSFWQVYDFGASSPFRETNHEPEVWAQFRSDHEFFGFKH